MSNCADILSVWGKEITGNFKGRINHSKRVLKILKGRRDSYSLNLYQEEKKKLNETYAQHEVFWRQRSKQLWLHEGDHNSKYFHSATKIRRRMNQINFLHDDQDNKVDWGSGLELVVESYFSNLFTSSSSEWDQVIGCISRRVGTRQNETILAEVHEKEVKAALFSMYPDKSPGPDCMTPGFYQKFWNIVKNEVVFLVRQFFHTGLVDNHRQGTNIALIPKKSNHVHMTDIRPISLCNVLYKVISKVLTNRLKEVVDMIIS